MAKKKAAKKATKKVAKKATKKKATKKKQFFSSYNRILKTLGSGRGFFYSPHPFSGFPALNEIERLEMIRDSLFLWAICD